MYISEDGDSYVGQLLDSGYIKNKDKRTTTPRINVSSVLNIISNTLSNPIFRVTCFDDKTSYGYFRGEYKTYKEAKDKYEELIKTFHIK